MNLLVASDRLASPVEGRLEHLAGDALRNVTGPALIEQASIYLGYRDW
jgi:hypothetical protein